MVLTQPPTYQCRFCGEPLRQTFVDLGLSPLCETYIDAAHLEDPELFYPLHSLSVKNVFWCSSRSMLRRGNSLRSMPTSHPIPTAGWPMRKHYVSAISKRLNLNDHSFVVEVASNDGYLLQYFRAMGIPVLGIEPAKNVAQVAIEKGIPSVTAFFGRSLAHKLAREGRRADLIVGNNVLAHVPDINDFVAGIEVLLKPGGVVTMEFPHLIRLVEENQFDTIYHEHFSYLSFTTVEQIFAAHGLTLFDVEELTTHGGSLRIYGRHAGNDRAGHHGKRHRIEGEGKGLGHWRDETLSRLCDEGGSDEAKHPAILD